MFESLTLPRFASLRNRRNVPSRQQRPKGRLARDLRMEPLERRELLTVQPLSAVFGSFSADGPSYLDTSSQATSADGRYVVFTSEATDLVAPGLDINGTGSDVFLFDRAQQSLTLISREDGTGQTSNGASYAPMISEDGLKVAFLSTGTNLVAGQIDANNAADLFLYDVALGTMTLVSHVPNLPTTAGDGAVLSASMSADGSAIAFDSVASNLITFEDTATLPATGLVAAGPIHPVHGFPTWYMDRNGSVVELMPHWQGDFPFDNGQPLVPDPMSISAPPTPGNAFSEAIGFDDEAFWWSADAGIDGLPEADGDTNGRALLVLAQEAAFMGPANAIMGNQFAFGRIRIRIDTPNAGLYTVVHPFGTLEFNVTVPDDGINYTDDNGDLYPYLNNRLLQSPIDTFLKSSQAPAGYLGDPGIDAPLAGGEVFSVTGPFGPGGQIQTFSTDQFAVVGRLYGGSVSLADRNETSDVFLWKDDAIQLVSHAADTPTLAGNDASWGALIDPTGQYVYFNSEATDLQPLLVDNNAATDVFRYDSATQTRVLVSGEGGSQTATANGASFVTSVDGQAWLAVIESEATNLVASVVDLNGGTDVYLFDGDTLALSLVSHAAGLPLQTADAASHSARISADGNFVALVSSASNLADGVTDLLGFNDVFLYDRLGDANTLVSHAAGLPDTPANGPSSAPVVSGDGRFVAFESLATDLMTDVSDLNGASDVFVLDRDIDVMLLASEGSPFLPGDPPITGDAASTRPILSRNGMVLVFNSEASDLFVPDFILDFNFASDVFLFATSNSAPVLDPAVVPTVALEVNAPVDEIEGTPIDEILATAGLYSDADGVLAQGLAIVGQVDTIDVNNFGAWEYSEDGGATWFSFGLLSDSAALLLSADGLGLNRVRFVPLVANFVGTPSFDFRGWDMTNGLLSGALVDVSVNGGSTAYSAEIATAQAALPPDNSPPSVLGFAKFVDRDFALNFSEVDFALNFFDPDADELAAVRIESLPAHGTLQFNGSDVLINQVIPAIDLPNLTYLADFGYTGPDSFTWNGSDGVFYAASPATVTLDVAAVAPSVTIDQMLDQADPTGQSPIHFIAVFSEVVAGFTANDVTLGGTAGATTVSLSTTDNITFHVMVSGMTQDGTVEVSIADGVAQDLGGDLNTASTSTDNVVTWDASVPSVTVEQAAGQADPTNAATILFTVAFSEAVSGFTADDIALGGTAGATTAVVTTTDNITYEVAVSGMTQDGTVEVSIADGVAQDIVGNLNTASTSIDNSATWDATAPAVTVNQASVQGDPTNASTILFSVVFSEAVSGFTADDIALGGTAGATTAVVTTADNINFDVAVSGMTQDGTVIVSIAAGAAQDAAGNLSAASTSTDNTVTWDATAPTVTINQAADQVDPSQSATVRFDVVFSEPVNGFGPQDVLLSGTAVGNKSVSVTGSGTTYLVTVTGIVGNGTVVAGIAAGAAQDAAGNASLASTSADNSVIVSAWQSTVGVYTPGSATFALRNSLTAGSADLSFVYGGANWTALMGDWDGDGVDTPGVYVPGTATFYLKNSQAGGNADVSFVFGGANWVPVVGDWDGDGKDSIGVYVPGTATFYLKNSLTGGFADVSFSYGGANWVPLAGDWDGDGKDSIGAYVPGTATFYLRNSLTAGNADIGFNYGGANWSPIIGDWNSDGKDTVGVYVPDSGTFYLKNSLAGGFADIGFNFGGTNRRPLAGDWNGAAVANLMTTLEAIPSQAVATLTQADAESLVGAAAERLKGAAALVALDDVLAKARIVVTNLPDGMLGQAIGDTIYLDDDAAGHGWFIDNTPAIDEEFESASAGALRAIDPRAVDRIDLLSVVEHELGHLAGLADVDDLASVMGRALTPGVRRSVR